MCSAHCAPTAPTFSYFVVLMDLGRLGREAVVDPEITRREVVARILTREYAPERIVFIHHVTDEGVTDVTFDVIADAARNVIDPPLFGIDRVNWLHDRAQDARKHGEPV